MRRLVILVLLLFPTSLEAGLGEDFQKAVESYDQGDFAQAAAGFQAIVDRGYQSAELYYNLGCAYFKAGRLGKAVVNFLRAERMAPDDEDIAINSQFVQMYQVDRIETGPEKFFPAKVERYLAKLHPNQYFWLSSLAFVLALLFLSLKQLRLLGRTARSIAIMLLLFSLVAGGSMIWLLKVKYLIDEGVVIVEQTEVLSGPGPEFELQFEAHEGLSFRILDQKEKYYLGLFANKLKGWVDVQDVERI
jgi:tetratricopeptide (TPR) repeat protein